MADEHAFAAELVTPEQALYSGTATAVVCRTSGGDLMVLAGHTPLAGDLVPGVVRIDRDGEPSRSFCVHGGFLEVDTGPVAAGAAEPSSGLATTVTMLAGIAEPVDEIDVARAQAARDAAAARVAQGAPEADDEAQVELALATAALARAELRLEAVAAASAQ